ncbi:MAG: hypothetical protein J7496_08595 [Novosphingobium sp.]|nr:hypothetical protein [Novosphingobium sp.]
MSNTLTALAPVAYSAAKVVAAEPFGMLDAINMNFDDKGVAKGDTVKVPVAPTRAASDFTPSNATSTGTDATASTVDVTITKSRKVSWNITGEQLRSLENAEADTTWFAQLLQQGMRTLRNEAEADAWAAGLAGASRAYGTAGTTPFASDLSALTNVRKILVDNGAPMADLQFVGDTAAGLNLRNLGVIQEAQKAGDNSQLRSGDLARHFGFQLRESAGVSTHTAGTAASATTDNAGYAVGSTSFTLASAGTGTLLTTDVITFAGDTNKYVVATGDSDVSNGGTLTLNNPGIRIAMSAATKAITMTSTYTGNLAFERSAIVGIMRPPLMPANPTISQLPVSDGMGLTYLLLDIAQYGQRSLELHLAWGFKSVNGEFSAIVLG